MKDWGSPFKEIEGPGVRLVEIMTEFEDMMREKGIEVEYKVEPDQYQFVWGQEKT